MGKIHQNKKNMIFVYESCTMHYLGRYRRNNFEVNVTVSFEKSYRVSEYELLIIRYYSIF